MEPTTHYQVSFTPRQALSIFVGLLFALGLAYFFGLKTGLAGREADETVTDAGAAPLAGPASAEPAAAAGTTGDHVVFPAPVTGVAPHATPVPTPAPAVIRTFEDGQGAAHVGAPVSVPTTRAPSSGGFRVQVVSVSSRADADAFARRLSSRGFAARVEPGSGASGAVYRVRVGPFATRAEASNAAARLAAEGRRDTWIVPPGQ
ncbi:MAG TPA: SPOR domain-containing protein [Thermoanaerobaculia bacterium]|nr:SPOR domain-containing protein [Thermoanaerobaculia bacterium]